jgi:hypothetical protein
MLTGTGQLYTGDKNHVYESYVAGIYNNLDKYNAMERLQLYSLMFQLVRMGKERMLRHCFKKNMDTGRYEFVFNIHEELANETAGAIIVQILSMTGEIAPALLYPYLP